MTALSWSALVIGATLTLLLFAFVVRRLIGVRVPVPRTLAAGVVAVLVFSPIVTAMIGGPGVSQEGQRAAGPVVRDPRGGHRAAGRHGFPGHRRGAGAERVGARAGLRAAGRARADGPGGSLLADQQDPGAAGAAAVCAGRAPVRAGDA